MFTYFTDTDTDITPEEAKKIGFKLISMPYSINDKDVYPYEDFDTFNSHEFYDSLRKGTLPKTFAISPEKYKSYFEPEFKKGNDILYVSFSKAMSGTFNAMNIALEELKELYPERKFYQIDTKGITIMSNIIVKEIADMLNSGKTVEEIVEWSKTEVLHYATYFFADNLSFFRKSGRVTNLKGFMGDLFGVRPILNMNADGMMTNIDKTKGRMGAILKLVDYVKELGDDVANYRIIIGHSDNLELAQKLEAELKKVFGDNLKIEYVIVNPTAGSHCGPDGIGVAFHSTRR
ncbi:MAG: DegV family protein [Acholeplasmatales bacterium]|nr:DegV family protein [Acholeplasmatales bacterium]